MKLSGKWKYQASYVNLPCIRLSKYSKAPVKVRLGDTDTETEYDCLDPNPRFDQECKNG